MGCCSHHHHAYASVCRVMWSICLIVGSLCASTAASAQIRGDGFGAGGIQYRSSVYPVENGASFDALYVGGEVLSAQRIGVGVLGEVGTAPYFWRRSLEATVHVRHPKLGRFELFAQGGPTESQGDSPIVFGGWAIGGGANFWGKEHAALRIEFLEMRETADYSDSDWRRLHVFRMGVTFH